MEKTNFNVIETARLIAIDNFADAATTVMLERHLSANSRPGDWDIAGGRIEANETPEIAASREFFEETGIAVKADDLEFIYAVSDLDNGNWYSRYYYRSISSIALRGVLTLTEHKQAQLLSVEKAIDLTTFVPHQEALRCALSVK